MDTLKTISQSVNEVDQMEPIFYGVLLFSSVSVFIMLICIFCCWQQNQLEDYSFVEQLNQRLIDSDRSLLNYPRSHEKAAAGQPNSMVRSPRPTYKTVNRDRFKQTTLKAIYEPPFNPSNVNDFPSSRQFHKFKIKIQSDTSSRFNQIVIESTI